MTSRAIFKRLTAVFENTKVYNVVMLVELAIMAGVAIGVYFSGGEIFLGDVVLNYGAIWPANAENMYWLGQREIETSTANAIMQTFIICQILVIVFSITNIIFHKMFSNFIELRYFKEEKKFYGIAVVVSALFSVLLTGKFLFFEGDFFNLADLSSSMEDELRSPIKWLWFYSANAIGFVAWSGLVFALPFVLRRYFKDLYRSDEVV